MSTLHVSGTCDGAFLVVARVHRRNPPADAVRVLRYDEKGYRKPRAGDRLDYRAGDGHPYVFAPERAKAGAAPTGRDRLKTTVQVQRQTEETLRDALAASDAKVALLAQRLGIDPGSDPKELDREVVLPSPTEQAIYTAPRIALDEIGGDEPHAVFFGDQAGIGALAEALTLWADYAVIPIPGGVQLLRVGGEIHHSDPPPIGLAPEPAPHGGEGDMWAELIAACEAEPNATAYPRELMLARRQQGIERYGQPLRRGDGRNHLADALQEALDLAVYMFSADGFTSEVKRALLVAFALYARVKHG